MDQEDSAKGDIMGCSHRLKRVAQAGCGTGWGRPYSHFRTEGLSVFVLDRESRSVRLVHTLPD